VNIFEEVGCSRNPYITARLDFLSGDHKVSLYTIQEIPDGPRDWIAKMTEAACFLGMFQHDMAIFIAPRSEFDEDGLCTSGLFSPEVSLDPNIFGGKENSPAIVIASGVPAEIENQEGFDWECHREHLTVTFAHEVSHYKQFLHGREMDHDEYHEEYTTGFASFLWFRVDEE